jgi:hypothetical protein
MLSRDVGTALTLRRKPVATGTSTRHVAQEMQNGEDTNRMAADWVTFFDHRPTRRKSRPICEEY